jgi:hypothetical protein
MIQKYQKIILNKKTQLKKKHCFYCKNNHTNKICKLKEVINEDDYPFNPCKNLLMTIGDKK